MIAATRIVLCASARPPRVFGGSTAGDRLAGAGRVVLGGPARQRDDVRRHERLVVEHLANRLDAAALDPSTRRVAPSDDAGHDSRSERHDDARADRRRAAVVATAIGQQIEAGNGNGDDDQQVNF